MDNADTSLEATIKPFCDYVRRPTNRRLVTKSGDTELFTGSCRWEVIPPPSAIRTANTLPLIPTQHIKDNSRKLLSFCRVRKQLHHLFLMRFVTSQNRIINCLREIT